LGGDVSRFQTLPEVMSLGALGACCPCGSTIKQLAISTSWNAFRGFGPTSSGLAKFARVAQDNTWKGGVATEIGGTAGVTEHFEWSWCGPLGCEAFTSSLDKTVRDRLIGEWGIPSPCNDFSEDIPSETQIIVVIRGKTDAGCEPYADFELRSVTTAKDEVDWQFPSLTQFDRKALDYADSVHIWDQIPDGWTGVIDLMSFFGVGNNGNPREINNNDVFSGIVSLDAVFATTPGLFTVNGQPASTTGFCGPMYAASGPPVNGPPGVDFGDPPTIDGIGSATPMYFGYAIRTRIEMGPFCVLQFDQIHPTSGGCPSATDYSAIPSKCTPLFPGPIVLEPATPAIVMAALTNAGQYPCCAT
jgi:hypothetical protein